MRILIDQDIQGDSDLLWGTLASAGWLELLSIGFSTFDDVNLPPDSDDRTVWRFAQSQQMLLLTGNRNMKDANSLERTIREESGATSLPVVTISDRGRLRERDYREQCIERLVELAMYIEAYLGAGRIYIP